MWFQTFNLNAISDAWYALAIGEIIFCTALPAVPCLSPFKISSLVMLPTLNPYFAAVNKYSLNASLPSFVFPATILSIKPYSDNAAFVACERPRWGTIPCISILETAPYALIK